MATTPGDSVSRTGGPSGCEVIVDDPGHVHFNRHVLLRYNGKLIKRYNKLRVVI